jgi:CheY-like chemotaxis protein
LVPDRPLLLLAEDEPLIALVVQDNLEVGGFDVAVANNGTEAISLLDEQGDEIAGVITDIRLGNGPDGWEVAKHARKLKPGLPVIYTTGDSAGEWTVSGVPNSVILQKPYAAAQLITAIATLLTESPDSFH